MVHELVLGNSLGDMGGRQNKSERDERAQKRVVLEKRWWKHMRKVMKRSDQSRKEINFEDSHRKELEEL
jgi:hypothetical protein